MRSADRALLCYAADWRVLAGEKQAAVLSSLRFKLDSPKIRRGTRTEGKVQVARTCSLDTSQHNTSQQLASGSSRLGGGHKDALWSRARLLSYTLCLVLFR